MKNRLLYAVLAATLVACSQPKVDSTIPGTQKNQKQDNYTTVVPEMDTSTEDKQRTHADCPYTKIKPATKLEIIKAEKEIEYTSKWHAEYGETCENWNLNTDDIETILRQSEEITSNEWHYNFDILPCYYRGEININGKRALFIVNSGASATLVFKDSSVHIGYKKSDFQKYFIKGRYELK